MAMTEQEWSEVRVGDVLRHDVDGDTYVVVDTTGGGKIILSRTLVAMNPCEWTRRRKTVDA